MAILDWLFGKKTKKNREQLEEEKHAIYYKNEKSVDDYVLNLCEQMIAVSKEIEEIRQEYKEVAACLNDIQMIESLEGQQKTTLLEIAANVSKLSHTRNEYLNAEKKISDETFLLMQEHEEEIPKVVRRLMDNEKELDTLKRDLTRLSAEKLELNIRREDRQEEQKQLKHLSVLCFLLFSVFVVVMAVFSYLMEWDALPLFIVAFLAALAAAYIVLRTQECAKEIQKCDINQNYAITLENRIKIKYVNMKNAVDYIYARFHVNSSKEFTYNYEQYLEICREQEKLKQTNEDLEYFTNRMIRMLRTYHLYDAKIWVNYADAMIEPKEMAELKEEFLTRRQNLKEQIEANVKAIQEMRADVEVYYSFLGSKAAQVQAIIQKVEEWNHGLL